MLDPDIGLFISITLFGAAGAYIIGIAMDGLMGDDGFGTTPNTVILMAGGFLGFYLPKLTNFYIFNDVTMRAVAVVCCAFLCLAVLAITKGVMNRLGY
jgi:hypothetical protein